MNKILCIFVLFFLIGCIPQIKSTLPTDNQIKDLPEKSWCTDEQIKDMLEELNIQIDDYEYIQGDCTGWANSKKAELKVKDTKYSLAVTHRSTPNSEGLQFCFETDKENDPLFIDARNQICEELQKAGFDQEYIQCKKGEYDDLEKNRINLKFGSTHSGTFFSQVNEECKSSILPR